MIPPITPITTADEKISRPPGQHPRFRPGAPVRKPKNFFSDHYIPVIISDLILLNLSIFGVCFFKIGELDLIFQQKMWIFIFALTVNILWLIVSEYCHVYRVFELVKLDLKIRDLLLGSILFFGIISLIYYEFVFQFLQLKFVTTSFLLFSFGSITTHLLFRNHYRNNMKFLKYAMVGGKASNIAFVEKDFKTIYGNNTLCVGRFGLHAVKGVDWLGNYNQVKAYIRHADIDKLFYIYSSLSKKEVQEIMQICRSRFIDFEIVPREVDLFKRGMEINQLAHLTILKRKKEPMQYLHNKLLKRGFDIVFSAIVILLIFPWLFPLIAVLIKLESPGPVFFAQWRTGYWNQPFKCYKFRSMFVHDEGSKQAVKGDQRITKIGAFLRKTNLDELPQFLNVLKGDMSVVGPRPHPLLLTRQYRSLLESYMIRHEVKPGITGWAQINGWRGPTETIDKMAGRVEFDVYYLEGWSLLFDFRCILQTVINMFKGEENAF